MSIFESKIELALPVSEVYEFLADFNNHERLMPGNVSNWSSTRDEARFSVQNFAALELKISNRIENHTIIIIPAGEVPFMIEMRWVLADLGENVTEAILTISAQLNMMMKVMAAGPLQKLADHQTKSLSKLLL